MVAFRLAAVHHILERLARREPDCLRGRNLDLGPGRRIAADPCGARPGGKRTETTLPDRGIHTQRQHCTRVVAARPAIDAVRRPRAIPRPLRHRPATFSLAKAEAPPAR